MLPHDLSVPHLHQAAIDREAALLVRMPLDMAELVQSIAWQIAKDQGMDDYRLALREARAIAAEEVL